MGETTRPGWDEYFMGIARQVSTRATCDRLHVGAVIVRDRNILATGYNGSVLAAPHCDEAGHDMEDGHCVRTVHAEANAICQAAKHGARIEGATLYTTAFPCWPCFRLSRNSGIDMVVFDKVYRPDPRILPYAEDGLVRSLGPATYWIVWPVGPIPGNAAGTTSITPNPSGPYIREEAYRHLQSVRLEGSRIYGIQPAF